ncbi:MAG TPA: hypothetical protein VHR17_17380 [Thermoanaerobaculia bacterium]|nr:hypothetical protein [Thermoanaerobaculia bacterium]
MKAAASLGKNESATTAAPIGIAIERLVVPVAADKPTLLENVD